MNAPDSPALSASQLATITELGEERTAAEGDTLYRIGDEQYPFIVILEGEAAVLDAAGNEITRHGPSKVLGEVNLLSGQAAFVTAVAAKPVRYIAVEREALRSLLFEDGPLSSLVLATFIARREALQQVAGIGLEIVGPHSSAPTRRLVEFARSNRLPFTWRNSELANDPDAAALVAGLGSSDLPLVRLPGGVEMHAPSPGELSRALGIGRELEAREEVDLLIVGAGPAGLGAAVYGASEGLETLVVESSALGGQAGQSRRIENYLGFPAGITGRRAHDACGRAGAEVRRPHRLALPGGGAAGQERGGTSCSSRRDGRSSPARCCLRPEPSTGVSP